MTLQIICEQAVELTKRNKLEEAAKLCAQILVAEPGNFTGRHLLGIIRFQQGKIAESLAYISEALKIVPDAAEALTNYGLVLHAAGRLEEALLSYDKSLSVRPRDDYTLYNRGNTLWDLRRFEEALTSYNEALASKPNFVEALYSRGMVLSDLMRFEEAVASYDAALAINPRFAMALNNRGAALLSLDLLEEAIASYDRALAIEPKFAMVLNNRGNALMKMERFEEALASYEKALAVGPALAETLNNRGNALKELKRPKEALASYDEALKIKPDVVETLNNRGNVLRDLGRLEEALADYSRVVAIEPRHTGALYNLGWLLCEMNRVEEGFSVFMRRAKLVQLAPRNARISRVLTPQHKVRHDIEQRAYILGCKPNTDAGSVEMPFHIENGDRLAEPAVDPANGEGEISHRWRTSRPQIVVIDNLLTAEALDRLRRFCWGSTVWGTEHDDRYLGAMPINGFSCPLLAQIANELRDVFPFIFGLHPLLFLWAFKYDNELGGIRVHADFAAINVNFWITPDEANLDPGSGGLVVWDVAAPPDWEFSKYNNDTAAIRGFLKQKNAKSITIPYRSNRAVIFDSDLFHETDRMSFKDGYLNRRINITLLYGRREFRASRDGQQSDQQNTTLGTKSTVML